MAGSKQPEQEFYEFVFKDMNLKDKKEVIFWDDDEKNINGAKEFGFNAELYENIEDFKNKLKNYNINV